MKKQITIANQHGGPLTLDALEDRIADARTQGVPGDAVLELSYDPNTLSDALGFLVEEDVKALSTPDLLKAFRSDPIEANRQEAWNEIVERLVAADRAANEAAADSVEARSVRD